MCVCMCVCVCVCASVLCRSIPGEIFTSGSPESSGSCPSGLAQVLEWFDEIHSIISRSMYAVVAFVCS